MYGHFLSPKHLPKPHALRIADREAFNDLPKLVQQILLECHGNGNRLLTAFENRVSHFSVAEQQAVTIQAFRALGVELTFQSSTTEAD